MKDSTVNVTIRMTTNYDRFRFLDTNRDVVEGHINNLKAAMQEVGNLTRIQPIVVNEHGDVIDGQNRLMACKELGLPVYYSVIEGLNINDARQMNILHRNWSNYDWAKSYAAQGNENYRRFLQLVEDYGFSYSVILSFLQTTKLMGMYKTFREGNLQLAEEDEAATRVLLDKYVEVVEEIGPTNRSMARALARVFKAEIYDHKRMLRKLKQLKTTIKAYTTVPDNMRQLEEIYNHGFSDANRVRLY
jgi:hypothetical protein